MFRCIKYSRNHDSWMLLLILVVVVFSMPIYGKMPTLGGCGIRVFLSFTGVLVADSLVEIRLRRMFKHAFSGIPRRISQQDVNLILRDLAVECQRAGDEERAAQSDRAFIGDYTRWVAIEAAQQKVWFTMKTFWRVHWLARIFGFEVKLSWKDYLPPAQPA